MKQFNIRYTDAAAIIKARSFKEALQFAIDEAHKLETFAVIARNKVRCYRKIGSGALEISESAAGLELFMAECGSPLRTAGEKQHLASKASQTFLAA